jgi:hypothetical protein
MKRALFLSASLLAVSWAAPGLAAPPQLMGEYAFTGTAGCLITSNPLGFDPQTFTPVADQVSSRTFSVEGIRTFNGDGTGTAQGTEVGITPPQSPPNTQGPVPNADSAKFSFSFTYQVNDDGTFSTELVPGTFKGHFYQGPRTGQDFTIDKIDLTGLLTNENKVLTLASIQAEQETMTLSTGEVHRRVCHRSRTLSWIGINQ